MVILTIFLLTAVVIYFVLRKPASSEPTAKDSEVSPVPKHLSEAPNPNPMPAKAYRVGMSEQQFSKWLVDADDDPKLSKSDAFKKKKAEEEEDFEEWLSLMAKEFADEHFPQRLAGGSYANDDGSSRQALIRKCKPMQKLNIQHEPTNPRDKNAVMVLTTEGGQLGYLPARCASEILRDFRRGDRFVVYVRSIGKDGPYYGMRLVIFRLNAKWREIYNRENNVSA